MANRLIDTRDPLRGGERSAARPQGAGDDGILCPAYLRLLRHAVVAADRRVCARARS